MGVPFGFSMEADIHPDNLGALNRAADEISSMWDRVVSFVVSKRKLPFFTKESEGTYLGEPIKKPEYNLELVIEERDTFEARQTSIAVNQDKIEVREQKYNPQLQA